MAKKIPITLAVAKELRMKVDAIIAKGGNGREWLRQELLSGKYSFVWKTDKDAELTIRMIVFAVYEDVKKCEFLRMEKIPAFRKGKPNGYNRKIYVELTMLDGSKVESSFRNDGTFKWYLRGYDSKGYVCDLRNGDQEKWKTSKDWDTNFKKPLENAVSEDNRRITWHEFTNLGKYKNGIATATLNFKLEGDEEIYTIPTVNSSALEQYKKGALKIIQEGMSRGELIAYNVLRELGIEPEKQAKFDGLVGVGGGALRYDFLFTYNGELHAFEVDGEFHRESVKSRGGDEKLRNTQEHDRRKNAFCEEHGINMIRFPYDSRMSSDAVEKGIRQKLSQHGIC